MKIAVVAASLALVVLALVLAACGSDPLTPLTTHEPIAAPADDSGDPRSIDPDDNDPPDSTDPDSTDPDPDSTDPDGTDPDGDGDGDGDGAGDGDDGGDGGDAFAGSLDDCAFVAMVRAPAPDFDVDEVNASLDELAGCDESGDTTHAPSLVPSVPHANALPDECNQELRVADVVAACGPLVDVDTLTQAAECPSGQTCHLALGAGTFASPSALHCVFVEGAGADTVISGGMAADTSVIAGVRLNGGVNATGDLLLNKVDIVDDYQGVDVSWSIDADISVCSSQIRSGYGGVGQSWESSRITVAGSAISACYEPVATAWGSQEMVAEQNVLVSGYGVNIHESRCSAVVDNVLAGVNAAVSTTIWPVCDEATMGDCSFDPPTQKVLVDGNVLVAGELPASMPERQIVINP